ncbi:MAG: Holliday junction branch migration protein RuvA [Chlamydiae bacterium]|nr:MAG: Holliday junction branch migration protein RuvA [Chlamydiota bacterium]
MIIFLEGILEEKQPTRAVINAGGIGHEVIISLNTYEDLPNIGTKVRLQTHHHIREDAEILFGFSNNSERDFFVVLIGISGVGPSLAINILSGLPLLSLRAAIAAEDVKRLSSIKGIGKKTAERIIVELKDKIPALTVAQEKSKSASPENRMLNDAVLALVALGYKNSDAYTAVKRVLTESTTDSPVEEIVRLALGSI